MPGWDLHADFQEACGRADDEGTFDLITDETSRFAARAVEF
jgi:hypothetical protein